MKYILPLLFLCAVLGCSTNTTGPNKSGENPIVETPVPEPAPAPIPDPNESNETTGNSGEASPAGGDSGSGISEAKRERVKTGKSPKPTKALPKNKKSEPLEWQTANAVNTPKAYQRYLANYPNGEHADMAREKLVAFAKAAEAEASEEEYEWRNTKGSNTAIGYKKFIQDYPQSKHVAEAYVRLKALERPASAGNSPGNENVTTGVPPDSSPPPEDLEEDGFANITYPDLLDSTQTTRRPTDSIGQMVYLLDTIMTIHEPSNVALIISKNVPLSEMKIKVVKVTTTSGSYQATDTNKVKVVKDLRLSEYMTAELESRCGNPGFFSIEPRKKQKKKVDLKGGSQTIWNWTVTPKENGSCILYLSVSRSSKDGGDDSGQTIEAFGKDIHVKVDSSKLATIVPQETDESTPGFWDANKWIVLGGLGILCLTVLVFFLLRKKESEVASAPRNFFMAKSDLDTARDLISKGKLKKALELLESALDDKHPEAYRQVLLHQSNLSTNEKNRQMDLLPPEDTKRTQNQIVYALLKLIDELEGPQTP